MKFMSGDVSNLQGGIPARTSVIKSDAFAKQASPDMVALAGVYVDALKQHAESSGQGGDPKQIYSLDTYWFFKALSEALEKKTPLGQGLAEAQQLTTAWLDCTAKTPSKPATCASQVDPKYQGYNTEDPSETPGMPGLGMPRG